MSMHRLKNYNIMVLILRAQTYVSSDVHMNFNVAELNKKLLANRIHANRIHKYAPTTF